MPDFAQTDDITSLLEALCREMKPLEPFPFKSHRISQGIRFQHYLILFPFYPEYKKLQHLYIFNLSTRKWGSAQLRNSPEILENTDNYKVLSDDKNGFILFGCYKAFQANTTGNLFFQSQAMTLKKTLGSIEAKIVEGELMFEWKEWEKAYLLPYREKFSANLLERTLAGTGVSVQDRLCIFGGCDENGIATNDMFHFNLNSQNVYKIELQGAQLGGDSVPCARMNHGAAGKNSTWIFGGEDQYSNAINDMWLLRNFSDSSTCMKSNKKSINRCPKLGTPSVWYGKYKRVLLYIAKSTTQTLPPFRSYLCIEIFDYKSDESMAWSQKEPLPFDGVPHTMEIFENQLILGFESSIYAITFDSGISPTPNFESYKEAEDLNDVMVMKKTRPKNFKGHMRQYFEEKPFSDVVFKVQGEEINAHRGILSVRSPFFAELFSAEEEKKPIEITDLSSTAFNVLLEWLYCNEILEMKDDVAVELLKSANKYSLPKLKLEAEKCLMNNLTVSNLLDRAKLAVEHKARELETAVVKFMAKEMDEVNKREELNHFPNSILYRVCKIGMMEKISDEAFATNLHKIKMK